MKTLFTSNNVSYLLMLAAVVIFLAAMLLLGFPEPALAARKPGG